MSNVETIKVVPARYPLRAVGAAVALFVLAVVIQSVAFNPRWEWAVFARWFFDPVILEGVGQTLLLTLIGDILDISRLETGKISFTLHPENIVAICQQVISTTAHGRKKDVECVFNPPVESFILKTDSQRLSQVLINLLTNASKFTEKGTIALAFEIQKEQRRILFSVSDTGCGIPRERQERVFNRFEKLNEFKQGTGLGLAICKQIVLRFGGNIWIDPEYTEGARFVFSHPIVP